ncbi:MAG: hypothetical protein ACK5MK_08085 [Dysgonomonas sp.]
MRTKKFTADELCKLKLSAIANKHGCTPDYVRKVLKEESREQKTVLARKIVADAIDMLAIVNRETSITI